MVTFLSLLDASSVVLSALEGFFVSGFRRLVEGFLGSGGASGPSDDSELGSAETLPGAAAVLRTFAG